MQDMQRQMIVGNHPSWQQQPVQAFESPVLTSGQYPQQQMSPRSSWAGVVFGIMLVIVPLALFITWGIFMEIRLAALQQNQLQRNDVETLKTTLDSHSHELAKVKDGLKEAADRFRELAELLRETNSKD